MKLFRKVNRPLDRLTNLPQSFAPNAVTQYGIKIPAYARDRQLSADLRRETVVPTNKPQEA